MLVLLLLSIVAAADTKCKATKCKEAGIDDSLACCSLLMSYGVSEGQKKCIELLGEEVCKDQETAFGCGQIAGFCMSGSTQGVKLEECKPTKNEKEYKEVCRATNKELCDGGYSKLSGTYDGKTITYELNCAAIPAKSAISFIMLLAMAFVALF